ncbi:hypothetical protein CKA32_000591 [Geitlerinema sp. FC II]|nr:hypothetical protein CKA32_000591 [Geitlerinema sp. FC II]
MCHRCFDSIERQGSGSGLANGNRSRGRSMFSGFRERDFPLVQSFDCELALVLP